MTMRLHLRRGGQFKEYFLTILCSTLDDVNSSSPFTYFPVDARGRSNIPWWIWLWLWRGGEVQRCSVVEDLIL